MPESFAPALQPRPALNVVPLFDGGAVLDRLQREADTLALAFRPLVDLAGGALAGWEALAALGEETPATPCEWSDRGRVRLAEAIEAELLAVALRARGDLPPGGLLSIALSARALVSAPVQQALAGTGATLDGTVLVIADGPEPHDSFAIAAALEGARQAGARVAIEESSPSVHSMRRLLRVQPDYIRAGGALVEELDRDPARAAAVEMLVALGRRIGAQVIVDGVARPEELEAATGLGADYAQGPLLGRPSPAMLAIPPVVAQALAARWPAAGGSRPAGLAGLLEEMAAMPAAAALAEIADAFLGDPGGEFLVLLDEDGRPVSVAERAALLRAEPFEHPALCLSVGTGLAAAARAAVARPAERRYAPVICCDARGRYVGAVRMERLVAALAA